MKRILKKTSLRIKLCIFLLAAGICLIWSLHGTHVKRRAHAETNSAYVNSHNQLVIAQHGITWTFAKQYAFGRYITGDFWVKGPVKIIRIDPPATKSGNTYLNGSMLNPSPALLKQGRQGWTSQALRYVPALNAARPHNRDLSPDNPLSIGPGASLCSSISRTTGRRPKIDTIAILTVVAESPQAGSFRPPYAGTDKSARYTISQIDFSIVDKKLRASRFAPTIKHVADYFSRPWIDLAPDHLSGFIAPYRNMPWYGREYAIKTADAILMLCLDHSAEEKKLLMIRYVQLGLDLYGAFQNGMRWRSSGGWMQGRKLPIVFAGLALRDKSIIKSVSRVLPDGEKFQEDGQTFYVTSTDVNRKHVRWKGARAPLLEYGAADLGMPEWGIKHDHRPEYDNKDWDTDYRHICGRPSIGAALAVHVLGVIKLWNWQAFFDYQDRFAHISKGLSDKAWRSQGSLFSRYMWEKYRSQYGPMWKSK